MGADSAISSPWALRDQRSIWHPFTQAQTASPPLPIVQGKGVYLYSDTGKEYIDAISSWWVILHGHAHSYIAQKIGIQAEQLEQVIFAGYTHPQAITLAERLLAALPSGYSRIFYSDNGSTAIETALKIALQSVGKKKRLLTFSGGYHGDTFGAMAAAGKNHFNRPFWPYLFEVESIPPPLPNQEEDSWNAFERALAAGDIGAFIFEPLIQGAGGMRPHSGTILAQMIRTCYAQGILTIADEVMTGFGRTGPLFACHALGVTPDIICLSKGITGGFLPLGATVVKEFLFEAFLSSDPLKALLHGHSYTANPLACAAANASLDLLLTTECCEARQMIEKEHQSFRQQWMNHPKLVRCDVLGTILVLEYKLEAELCRYEFRQRLIEYFLENGIILRPLGNILYLLPPYCISQEELRKIYSVIIATLEEWK